jgi:membrane protein
MFRRAQSLVFVMIATICFLAVSVLVVLAPFITEFSERHLPWLASHLGTTAAWRYTIATTVIVVALIAVHAWLPDGHRRLTQILPGIAVTLIAWIGGSLLFAYYLERFSTYAKTYAGLASIMIAIVFLYIVSAIFILGGEINAAIRLRRERLPG